MNTNDVCTITIGTPADNTMPTIANHKGATETTISEIVADDFRTAAVFQKHGLDFCCGGGVAVAEACRKKGIDLNPLVEELNAVLTAPRQGEPSFNSWTLDFLVDYIVNNHHSYVRQTLPVVYLHAEKVARVHGDRHPEVVRLFDLFSKVSHELLDHMRKEEMLLFPYIRSLVEAQSLGVAPSAPPFGSVRNPIRIMEEDHLVAGDELRAIRELTNNYTPPEDACMTYRVLYQELHDFESDLHRHVHLENNILFPKATALEAKLGVATT
jgi:regulator of cell morphogenesis and NO signaling